MRLDACAPINGSGFAGSNQRTYGCHGVRRLYCGAGGAVLHPLSSEALCYRSIAGNPVGFLRAILVVGTLSARRDSEVGGGASRCAPRERTRVAPFILGCASSSGLGGFRERTRSASGTPLSFVSIEDAVIAQINKVCGLVCGCPPRPHALLCVPCHDKEEDAGRGGHSELLQSKSVRRWGFPRPPGRNNVVRRGESLSG